MQTGSVAFLQLWRLLLDSPNDSLTISSVSRSQKDLQRGGKETAHGCRLFQVEGGIESQSPSELSAHQSNGIMAVLHRDEKVEQHVDFDRHLVQPFLPRRVPTPHNFNIFNAQPPTAHTVEESSEFYIRIVEMV